MTVKLTTLSNGLRIVTEDMPGLKSASAGVWVTAGGRHERPEQNGIAHFLEHMAFKGTRRRSALRIAEEIAEEHQRVRGVIIALEDDLRIKRALKVAPNIDFYRYEVKFDLKKV